MIKSTFVSGLVMGLLATCTTAVAQEAVPEGAPAPEATAPPPATAPAAGPNGAAVAPRGALELGLRIGFGYPVGSEGAVAGASNNSLHDDISGMIPVWIDAGWRANPNVYVGLFFQYGFAFVNNDQNPDCAQSGVSCSAKDLRLGVNVHYHFSPGESFDPWVGVGAGYEWLALDVSAGTLTASETAGGFEFGNLQLGGDFAVAPNLGIGPFFAITLAEYNHLSGNTDADLATKSIHGWVMGGVRGVFDIGL
jgi:opacity protein-like surface antigen